MKDSGKKGLLEKLGILVDEEETENVAKPVIKNTNNVNPITVPGGISQNSGENSNAVIDKDIEHVDVVKRAYDRLTDYGENIFVVEDLLKNLSALPEPQRFQTLQSTLTTMGKDIKMFVREALERKKAIKETFENHRSSVNNQLEAIKNEINEANEKINLLTQKSLDLNNGIEVSKKECEAENKRLDLIISVLGGEVGGK